MVSKSISDLANQRSLQKKLIKSNAVKCGFAGNNSDLTEFKIYKTTKKIA